MAKNTALEDALKTVGNSFKSAIKGETILHSNSAIGKISAGAMNNGLGVGEVAYRVMGAPKQGFKDAVNSTFRYAEGHAKAGQLNYGKIAGSYIGASAAARVVTGGGITKDGNGNSNLIGVPFI